MSLENLAKLAESLPNITRLNLKNNTVSMMVKQYCISSELLLCRVNSRVVILCAAEVHRRLITPAATEAGGAVARRQSSV
jgi:hypothetical protein